ncbi:DNA polymerase III subunit gamma/tau [Colwellia hornerae]|uniref:DNA polymerase III subunit gamma/tau n=1 Tax=Colwellia hornerae TaxID=89402 RepID=A0A5C6QQX7_9GAMM|nr:DNA polymerase III subunit gamma/tau [Colwellia hornerae]TWX55772.1 DNA polymerase III subunit gamma/tau [Colwellia hornerae]TWX61982.1 DNA polymerase III subunit gamma/tau [Colwellia hornerae]TWX71314.1 DNA polymerase III subunit gamma/tau [Colwellia hornerae]
MSYQVLARKWRPKKFTELVGQEHVVTVLVNALEQQRLHHAYLFTGTRGVGKTTIARIFAKSLNCEQGITSTPCGVCDTCQDIDQGRFIDLLEIDAASKTKVDDTREILDNVQYAPTRGRYKVYLIDEVHMLSRSSFNALLKTLEEPPEHVKFILATTDPQKLPVTVLSRCLQFHLKALTVSQIEQKTQQILTAEDVSVEPGALTLLAKAARGSMRDCLSLTDQSIAQGQGSITLANVQQMLGGVDQNWVFKILITLLKQDPKALMLLSLDIASYAPNYSRLTAELIQLLHQIAMTQVIGQHFDLSPEHNQLVDKFSKAMSAEDIQLYYQIVLNGRKDLPYASDEQAAFDMLLLRLLAFTPLKNNHSLPDTKASQVSDFDEVNFDDSNISKADDFVAPLVEQALVEQALVEQHLVEQALVEQPLVEQALVEQALVESPNSMTNVAAVNASQVTTSPFEGQPVETLEQDAPSIDLAEAAPSIDTAIPQSPIEKAIATRNMLRSRKKGLENSAKKSNDAKGRQDTNSRDVIEAITPQEPRSDVPALTSISEQAFDVSAIDPAKIRSANQVDKWANMIDAMSLTGRLRQLAIHATVDEQSTDDLLLLNLNQATKHLNSDVAHKKLEQCISEFLQRQITVELTIVDETSHDPYQIQTHINDKRYDYAKELLQNDEIIIGLKTHFQAQLDENTIVAL